MAIMLLDLSAEGKLLTDGESSLSIEADEEGERYSISGVDGSLVDSGDKWEPLAARLDMSLSKGEDILVIWP